MEDQKKIVILSDGTGRTARRLMDAVLSQYAQATVRFELVQVYQEVRTRKQIDRIMEEIKDDYLVIYSIISEPINKYCHKALNERDILHVNVLEPMLKTMRKFLGVHPDYQPGILYRIDDRYYKKVDAIGYTVEHDDGRGALLEEADLVLLGLSRTCKTPISMYLACNYGLKVGNIPVVPEITVPKVLDERLDKVRTGRIFGLLMDPEVLSRVREERLEYLAKTNDGPVGLDNYFDVRVIRKDYRYCRELFEARQLPTIDVTRRAIEEISMEILDGLGYRPEE